MDRQQDNSGSVLENKEIVEVIESLSRLGEYEKTGLTPEQIMQMDAMYADKCRELAEKRAAGMPEDAKQTILQLEGMHAYCMRMAGEEEAGKVWEEDCKALEIAVEAIRQQAISDNSAQTKKGKMRIYISGPISGTDDYMDRFADAEDKLTRQGYSVVNPAKVLVSLPVDFAYEECMSICMELLNACGAICMLDGWENSLGANREYGYALARGMHIVNINMFERGE